MGLILRNINLVGNFRGIFPQTPPESQLSINGVLQSFTTGSIYNFTSAGTYTVIPKNKNIVVDCFMWGAAGGNQFRNSTVFGGGGGYTKGRITLIKDQTYTVIVGGGGILGDSYAGGSPGAGGAGGGGQFGGGGGGGGYTGLFVTDIINQLNAKLIAGGGGGGSPDPATGGGGGGSSGSNSSSSAEGRGGGAGSQTAGGQASGSYGGNNGSALQGGSGSGGGAGGGGGYYGGGGGGSAGPGGGGGGSGFIGGSGVTLASTVASVGSTAANPDNNKPSGYGDATSVNGQSGYLRLVFVSDS